MHSEQAAPDLLQKSLDASGVGWWQLDFGQREMTCSRLAADLFGADRTRISFEEVYLLPGEEHRARIYTRCAALKVSDSLDETFVTANGDRCLQVRAVAAANDPLTGVRSVFGTVRRVTEGTPENAELASINQSYKATQRNYSHLAQLIEHLPIGYLRVNILRDKSGEAVDYLLSYINQQAGRILGIHTQGHAGKTAREVGIDPLKHIPTFEHIPSCSFWEQTGKSPDGKRTCRCLIYNTPGDDDELVILLEDITDATRSRTISSISSTWFRTSRTWAASATTPLRERVTPRVPGPKITAKRKTRPPHRFSATGGRSIPTTGNTLRRSSNASKPEKSGLSSTKCAS